MRILSVSQEYPRVAVMLCYTAYGHKLPLCLFFKCNMLPKCVVQQSSVIVHANKEGWVGNVSSQKGSIACGTIGPVAA